MFLDFKLPLLRKKVLMDIKAPLHPSLTNVSYIYIYIMVQMKKFNAKKSINSTTHKGNTTHTQPKQSANKTSTRSIIAPVDKCTNPGTTTLF
jgi:hypothetical protein